MSRREVGRHGFVTPGKPGSSWEREAKHSWREGAANGGERSLRRGEAGAARFAKRHCSSKTGAASNLSTVESAWEVRGRKFCVEKCRRAEGTADGFRSWDGSGSEVRHAEM